LIEPVTAKLCLIGVRVKAEIRQHINTSDSVIGQVNGLTVLQVGGSSFGAPSRITVTVYPGSRGIVDIEREAELGLAIHSKGVMILTGYLGNCYAQDFPLAISASIALEQSYGHIDLSISAD
jgi:predicted ATP-dependent protease